MYIRIYVHFAIDTFVIPSSDSPYNADGNKSIYGAWRDEKLSDMYYVQKRLNSSELPSIIMELR